MRQEGRRESNHKVRKFSAKTEKKQTQRTNVFKKIPITENTHTNSDHGDSELSMTVIELTEAAYVRNTVVYLVVKPETSSNYRGSNLPC